MLASQPHILVVDDDDRLRALLSRFLAEQGFMVATADCAESAHQLLKSLVFDLLVVDIMMPGQSGLEFTAELRQTTHLPILLLTARGAPNDRIEGLEAGADDYLAKPFEPRELVLRINAILRRAPRGETGHNKTLSFGDCRYDIAKRELTKGSEIIRLTETEGGLLALLAGKPGDVVTRDELLAANLVEGNERAVDVLITRLRRKLESDPRQPRYVQTVRGEGYRLVADA